MMDIRRGQSGQAVKPSLELIVAQHQRRPTQRSTSIRKQMRAYAPVAGPSIMLAAGGRDPGASAASTDRSCMAYGAELEKSAGNRPEKSAAPQTHNEKAGCEMHGSSDGNKTACLGSGSPLVPRTKVRSPLIPLTAAVAEPNLMGRGGPVVDGRPSCGGLA
jgi:hypothetical protein